MAERQDIRGQILRLSELIEYAEGAVVSKTLLDKPSGTLTLFAFDAGQGLSEHTSPYDATLLVLDGTAELVIAGQSLPAQAGEMVIMPANVPHAVRAATRFKMLLIMIR